MGLLELYLGLRLLVVGVLLVGLDKGLLLEGLLFKSLLLLF